MLKKICIIVPAAILTTCLGCKPAGRYADLKEYLNESIMAEKEYISDLAKANSAKEVAEAITDWGNKMEKLAPRAEKLKKKYSELHEFKTMDRKSLPPELREEFETIDKLSQNLLTVSMKKMKFMMDTEVMRATQDMMEKAGKASLFK
jgi:hypothetical protein